MPVPVYSTQIHSKQNFAGVDGIVNGTGDLLIVRTCTVFYGGATPSGFFFIDQNGATMLNHFFGGTLAGDTTQNVIWTNLHLCWPDGVEWSFSNGNGTDYTIHGYQLSLP